MEKTIALSCDLDDIVFAHRNRAYGAYVLRKNYGNHIKKGGIWGFALFTFLMASPLIGEKLNGRVKLEEEKNIFANVLPPPPDVPKLPPPPPPPPPPARQPIATRAFTPPKVLEDDKVVVPEDIPKLEDIKDAVSTRTQDGVKGDLPPIIEVAAPPIETPIVEEKKKEEPEIVFVVVEQAPEFPNGLAAMYKFLRDNIKYPTIAHENGISGTVYVGFVVSKDGTLRDIQIKRGIGGGCNEEAMRVINLMPKWNAGKQNGKAVSVAFTLPVKFHLE
jgi:protein TonB